MEKENKNLKEQLLLSRQNFENLETNTVDIQEKFFKQCQAYDSLTIKHRELSEKAKKAIRSASISSKSPIRLQKTSPVPKNSEKPLKETKLEIEILKEKIMIPPFFQYKNLIDSYQNTIDLLKNSLFNAEQDAIDLNDKLKNSENEYKNLKKTQKTFNQSMKEAEKKIFESNSELKVSNEKVENLMKIKSKNEKDLETFSKKLKNLECIIDSIDLEKKTLENIITNYQSRIEEMTIQLEKNAYDKDVVSLQKDLKYAKNLVIKNSNEINKLAKEKEALMQEISGLKKNNTDVLMKAEINQLKNALEHADKEKNMIEARLLQNETENKNLLKKKELEIDNNKRKIEELYSELNIKLCEIKNLESENNGLKDSIFGLKENESKNFNDICNKQAEFQEKETKLIELNYSLNKEYQNVCIELNTVKTELNSLKKGLLESPKGSLTQSDIKPAVAPNKNYENLQTLYAELQITHQNKTKEVTEKYEKT